MQLVLNILISSGEIALIGVGFALIYQTTRFFHFAHGAVFTSGAYFVLVFKSWLAFPLLLSVLFAVPLCILLGYLMELFVYRHLRNKGSSPLVLLLASLGIYIVIQNVISIIFGNDTKVIRSSYVKEGLDIFGARITPVQIVIVCVSIVLLTAVILFLKKTRIGKSLRAVANDPQLANVSGIDSNQAILATFCLGSALAGIAGILFALDVDMTPTMGMNALMMGVVAVIIGGVRSIPGIALGSLLLGTALHVGVWTISSQWQDAIAFVTLLVFLVIRPEGFMGKKISKTTM